jgi:sugar/nucleoside kinase (ribokinase family)
VTRSPSPAVLTVGYVGLDHVVGINHPIASGRTSLVARRHTPEGGRLGGCAPNIALGLAEAACRVDVVTWVGDDAGADRVFDALRGAGISIEGVQRGALERTSTSWLPYVEGGASYCVYDPGGPMPALLGDAQHRLCATTRWCAIAIGPPGPTAQALDLLRDDATLLWPVKADPESVPPALARRLAARADAIVLNLDESSFLAEVIGADWRQAAAARNVLVVETRGASGLRWQQGRASGELATTPVEVSDTVGAGDRFCAGVLAGLAHGLDVDVLVHEAADGVAELLRRRLDEHATATHIT